MNRYLRAAAVLIAGLILPYVALETWARTALFDGVSYTRSVSLDATWKAFAARHDWRVVAVGDSEVRWGFDPSALDSELAAAGLTGPSFNLGIDGFSNSLYARVLPFLDIFDRAPNVATVLIGIELGAAPPSGHPGASQPVSANACRGALQRPIFESAFAKDVGLDVLCRPQGSLTELTRFAERVTAVIRYRSDLKAWLLRDRANLIGFQSTGLPYHPNGYQPHLPIRQARRNFELGWERVLEEARENGQGYRPLEPSLWENATAPGGVFDGWMDYFRARGVLPVFYALPTNPILIDVTKRRQDYQRNSELMAAWAADRNVPFIDLGIMDGLDPELDYSDHRHLSERGASLFTARLARAIVSDRRVQTALGESENGASRRASR